LVVVNKGAASASIIDVQSGRTLAVLPTGDGPHEVAISSDGATAVVTDYGGRRGGNTLTVIDVEGLAVSRTIDLGTHRRPHGIAYLPGDSLVAITSEASRRVVLVRVDDGMLVRLLPTDQRGSHMLAAVADGSRIYTGNIGDHTVTEIGVPELGIVRIMTVPPEPEAIGVTPDGSEVWVGSNSEGTVSVIDTRTGGVETPLRGFGWPYRILISADASLALIPDLRGNQLRIVERASRGELRVLDFPGAAPQGITLSTDQRTAFLALSREDRVAIIDLPSGEIIGHVETGSRPDGVAFTSRVVARP
jgi:YVTN family beta-propeller protein